MSYDFNRAYTKFAPYQDANETIYLEEAEVQVRNWV